MKQFKFELESEVQIDASGEHGKVLARAEYVTSENQYYIRYKCGDGRAVESWWGESALKTY